MPYIDQKSRNELQTGKSPSTPGELNYLISSLLSEYTKSKGVSYQTINDVLGACEGAKQEYYRRIAVPMENLKLSTNGDVY
jgi:hypothetical protein